MSQDPYPDDEGWEEQEEGFPIPEFLLDPVGVIRRRWLLMSICFAVGLGVTAVAYLSWVPTYWSAATILIESQKIPEDFVQSTVREDTLDNLNAMFGKVLSGRKLSKLIDDLDLFPEVRDEVPRIDLVNAVRSRVGTEAQQSRSVRRGESALVYEISYVSSDPAESAAVANALAEYFIEASIERRNSQARDTTGFLKAELERVEEELREQRELVAEFRRAHRGELPSELDANLGKLDRLAERRGAIEQRIAEKENRIHALTLPRGEAPLTESEALLDELRRQLARESAIHTDEHPNVIALKARIEVLEGEIAAPSGTPLPAAQKALIDAERRDIDRLRASAAEIDAEIADLNRRIDRTPRVAEELEALEEKERVLSDDYHEFQGKVNTAELAESLEAARHGGQVKLLDEAQPATRPDRPRWLIALLGLGASGVLALGIAVLLEFVDPVIAGPRQLGKLSDTQVLGSLPDMARA